MANLTDEQEAVLKELHDGVIRPLKPIADRTDLPVETVERSLRDLKEMGFVEVRPGNKWKIKHDGKVYLTPWFQRPVGIVLLGLLVAIIGGIIAGVVVVWLSGPGRP